MCKLWNFRNKTLKGGYPHPNISHIKKWRNLIKFDLLLPVKGSVDEKFDETVQSSRFTK